MRISLLVLCFWLRLLNYQGAVNIDLYSSSMFVLFTDLSTCFVEGSKNFLRKRKERSHTGICVLLRRGALQRIGMSAFLRLASLETPYLEHLSRPLDMNLFLRELALPKAFSFQERGCRGMPAVVTPSASTRGLCMDHQAAWCFPGSP